MILYLDVGNTRIKLLQCILDIDSAELSTNDDLSESWWRSVREKPSQIIGMCVREKTNQSVIDNQCQQQWGLTVHWLTTTANAAGMVNAYAKPSDLGIDRWAAMAGAHGLYQTDCIVADFGTATTFDALTISGQHLGGWIMPGIHAMQALQKNRLPHLFRPGVDPGKVTSIAANTMDALASGIWQSQAAALQRFTQLACDHGLSAPECILTGGHAESIASLLGGPLQVVPKLVFHGMQKLAESSLL